MHTYIWKMKHYLRRLFLDHCGGSDRFAATRRRLGGRCLFHDGLCAKPHTRVVRQRNGRSGFEFWSIMLINESRKCCFAYVAKFLPGAGEAMDLRLREDLGSGCSTTTSSGWAISGSEQRFRCTSQRARTQTLFLSTVCIP